MTITELKDRFHKLGCDVRWNHGEVHIIKQIPVELANIDDGSIMYFNDFNRISNKQRLDIKNLCKKYYIERNDK